MARCAGAWREREAAGRGEVARGGLHSPTSQRKGEGAASESSFPPPRGGESARELASFRVAACCAARESQQREAIIFGSLGLAALLVLVYNAPGRSPLTSRRSWVLTQPRERAS